MSNGIRPNSDVSAKDLYLRYNNRPCNKQLTYDPLNLSHRVYCGAVAQVVNA